MKKNNWKDLYLEMEQKRDTIMKNVIEVRVKLYTMFPDKIENISKIFQLYNFG